MATRWYEVDPVVREVMHRLEGLRPQERQLVCDWFLQGFDDWARVPNSQHTLKQLGETKLKGLWLGNQRRRWYDEDPLVHRTVKALFLQEPAPRHELALRFKVLLNHHQAYATDCAAHGQSPQRSAGGPMIHRAFLNPVYDS